MSSFRLTNVNAPAPSADSTATGEPARDSAMRQTETVASRPSPTALERAAVTAPLTVELPPSGPRTLNPERSTGLVLGVDGQFRSFSDGLNQPAASASPPVWPPDPFSGPPTPAGEHIWQAIDRSLGDSAPAPRPTVALGFSDAMGEHDWAAPLHAQERDLATGLSPTTSTRSSPPVDAFSAPVPVAKRKDDEEAERAGDEGAFWYRRRNHGKADNSVTSGEAQAAENAIVPPNVDAAAATLNSDAAQQHVFEQTALNASFAPLSAQIVEQRDAAQRRRWSSDKARKALKTLRLFGRGRRESQLPLHNIEEDADPKR